MQRNKKRKRRLGRTLLTVYVIAAGIALLGLLLVKGLIAWNLHKYAYYYATHMPHAQNEYPFIRELDVRKIPESVNKDFPNAHNLDERKGGGIGASNLFQKGDYWSLGEDGLAYYPNFDGNFDQIIFYDINHKFRLGKVEYSDLTPSPKDYQRTIGVLKKLEKRLKNESPKPIINLQWLYNLCYQNKRSETY